MKHKEPRESTFGDAIALLVVVAILFLFATALFGCNGDQGPRGITGAKGDTGQSVVGPAGSNGSNGTNGNDGHDGNPGRDGTDAIPVTVVNLCPGVTSYPGVFVEVALCLQGQLYGVYSANNGFLTLLPPGTYSSNAIGSACNLTISANCVISH